MGTLPDEAVALLAKVDEHERGRAGKLTAEDRSLILRLAAKGTLTQAQIAQAVGCTQPTVSRVLALIDTRKEARVILESGAAKLAATVVETEDAGIALKALGKLDVVREDAKSFGSDIVINIGPGANTPPDPSCFVVDVQPVPDVT